MPEFLDFTHRTYRPNHEPMLTPRGIPIDFHGLNPQKAGALLCKCSRKKGGKPTGGKGGAKMSVKIGGGKK